MICPKYKAAYISHYGIPVSNNKPDVQCDGDDCAQAWSCRQPVEESEKHTCYFCGHEGYDVNRIALLLKPHPHYACDYADECEERLK